MRGFSRVGMRTNDRPGTTWHYNRIWDCSYTVLYGPRGVLRYASKPVR